MKIEKGMVFFLKVNNVCFEILEANEKNVTYKVLLNNVPVSNNVHTFGRNAFKHCLLTRVK